MFFHWVPTRGPPAAGSAPRKRPAKQNPPFSKGKDEISLVVEALKGISKRMGQLVLGQNKFWGPKDYVLVYILTFRFAKS